MIGSRGTVLRASGRQLTRVFNRSRVVESDPEHSTTTLKAEQCGTVNRVLDKTSPGPANYKLTNIVTATMPETQTAYPTLEKLGLLSASHIHIKNKANTEDLLTSIVDGGYSKLQLVVDFDFTLTKVHTGGDRTDRCHCSWGILDNSTLMPAYYREEANKLLGKYYPIEIDPKMSEEQKIPQMIDWYHQIHQLIVKCQISRQSLESMVHSSNAMLRDGTEDMCKKLQNANVPVLVFSAGMGDILVEVLKHFKVYTDNVKVVSNFFEYSEEDVVIGFQGQLIHMFNKNENAIHKSDYFNKLEGHTNVILMGDSLGDTKMAMGVPQPSNILKIGFLNDKIEERLEAYLNNFDIVLIDDQTMDVANSIVDVMK